MADSYPPARTVVCYAFPPAARPRRSVHDHAETVAAFRERLKPAAAADYVAIEGWVKDLDNDNFQARQRASEGLAAAGRRAEPALRRALAADPPTEARRRVEKLLERLPPPSAGDLRASRAVETLGQIDTADAHRLLEALAQGATAPRLTVQARTALYWRARQATRSR
jgi:hypothetical protein